MNNTIPYSPGSLYYRHSGRVSPGGLLMAGFGGSAVAMILGVTYAYIDLYNPIAGWITFLVTGGTGFGMGMVISKLIKSGKIRNVPLATLLSIYLAGLMFVTAWLAWTNAWLRRGGVAGIAFIDLLDPRVFWQVVSFLYHNGGWSFRGGPVKGPFLAILWIAEAACLLGIPVAMGYQAVREVPFCEKCGKWCGMRDILNFMPGDRKTVIPRLEGKDFTVLTELGKASTYAMQFWHATFQGCPDCDTTQTLCITECTLTRDNKGNLQTKRTPVITQLILSPEDVVAVATAAATVSAGAEQPEAAPESTVVSLASAAGSTPPPSPPSSQNAG